jgi:tetratricopeptide (TPR) repeat protein
MKAEEYSKRGDNYFHEKNFDGAIADYTEVIKLESDNPFAYSKRGMSYINKKEYDLAISDFTEAIKLEPNKFGDFYMDRASAYVIKGNNVLAIPDLEMALKIDPHNETYREALKEIRPGASSTNTGGKTNESIRKEIKIILVGAIIGGVVGAITLIIGTIAEDYSMSLAFAIILGLWAGVGVGGNITFVLYLFLLGWNKPPFAFGWKHDRSESFFFNLRVNLLANALSLFCKLSLAFLFTYFGFIAFVVAGPIWPLIRVLMRRSKLKNTQAQG